MKQERLKIHAFLRSTNCVQHSRKDHFSIMQELDLVAVDRQRIGKRMRRREELRIFDGELVVEVVFDDFPPDKKDTKDQQSEKQCREKRSAR